MSVSWAPADEAGTTIICSVLGAATVSGEFQHIDLAYLEHMTEGDRALQRDALEMLTRELQTEIPKLRALHDEGRWGDLAAAAHRFKTSLAYVGNEAAAGATREIERLASLEAGRDRLPGLLAELEAAAPKILAELQAAAAMPR